MIMTKMRINLLSKGVELRAISPTARAPLIERSVIIPHPPRYMGMDLAPPTFHVPSAVIRELLSDRTGQPPQRHLPLSGLAALGSSWAGADLNPKLHTYVPKGAQFDLTRLRRFLETPRVPMPLYVSDLEIVLYKPTTGDKLVAVLEKYTPTFVKIARAIRTLARNTAIACCVAAGLSFVDSPKQKGFDERNPKRPPEE